MINIISGNIQQCNGDIVTQNGTIRLVSPNTRSKLVQTIDQNVYLETSTIQQIIGIENEEDINNSWNKQVLNVLGIDSFVKSLENSYKTELSELRGLSFGEMKRLQLGRLFISPSPILCLDEPLNGLDNVLKQQFLEVLRLGMRQKNCYHSYS